MKKYSRLLVLFIVLGLFVMGQAGCPGCGDGIESVVFGKISGVVYGSISNTLIYKATVTATGSGRTYSTLTDESGRYELGVPFGTYTVTVSKETFNDASTSVTVNLGETKTQNFNLTTGSGHTIAEPSFGMWVAAYTIPSEVDVRSLKFNPNKDRKLEFNPNSLPILTRDSTGYRSFIRLEVQISPSSTDISNIGVKGVRFYKSDNPSGPFTLIDSILLNSYGDWFYAETLDLDPSITPGVSSKYYTYSSWNDNGESPLQGTIRTKPLEPCILSSPPNGATVGPTPIFSWNPVPGADSYYIRILKKTEWEWWEWVWENWNIDASTTSITYGTGGDPSPAPILESGKTYGWIVEADKWYSDLGGQAESISYLREFSVSTSP